MKLPSLYYRNNDVVFLAKDLLGKFLFTKIQGELTGGIITETEAYAGIHDQASHAYGDKKTNRTRTMYQPGGISYIYLCYGIHYLFNVVTGEMDVPHAILIRSIFPVIGQTAMMSRTGKSNADHSNTNGPGKLSKAMGISIHHNGTLLTGDTIWIEDKGFKVIPSDIQATKRIGVDYAGSDAQLLYRFVLSIKKAP
jgi:DNA-3-methyladenine glycosylase